MGSVTTLQQGQPAIPLPESSLFLLRCREFPVREARWRAGWRGSGQVRSYIPNPKLDRACRRSRTAPPGPTLATAGPSPAAALDERCRPLQDGCGDAMHAAGAVLRLRSLLLPAAGSDGLALAAAAGACLAQNMAAIYGRPLSASTVPIGYQAASRGPRARGLVMGPRYIPSGLFLSRRLLSVAVRGRDATWVGVRLAI